MTDTKYIDTPWEISPDAEGVFTIHAKAGKSGGRLATVTAFKDDFAEITREQAKANAQLIAAALELLEALEHVYTLVDRNVSPDAPWAIEKAKAAIAKATGKAA